MPIKPLRQINTSSLETWRPGKQSTPKRALIKTNKNSSLSSFSGSKNRWGKRNAGDNNWKKILLKKLFFLALILAGAGTLFISIFILIVSKDLPNPDQLMERQVAQSTIIYDRTGENVLYEISGEERRTLISINEIPDYVQKAVVAIEDKNFYKHKGFSFFAMARTAVTNVIYHRSAGGSTLTQQFVKNSVLTNEKTIIRKIKELIISYRLEKKFSKDEILQMYLNEIPYGSNAYGVEAASQKYFSKSVREVSLAEAAVLAAIVQVPTRYSPYGPNKDILLGRKDYVLKLMAEQGYISEEEKELALAEEIVFSGKETNITAPHFVMYIKDILTAKYGEKMVEQGGLKIYTTLDLEKQKIAEEVIKEKTEKYQEKYNASNAALVAIDPKTGQILAMVGSRDYFDDSIDGQVNVSIRNRQPGSSIKPLVYATLFEKGYTPDTILYDVNTNFSSDPSNPYEPKNYNLQESGPISIKKSLAGSLNIPAVKALYLAGLNNVISLLESFGYSTFSERERFGLAFVLGGAEVKLLEHVNAFSAFATEGDVREISGILKVENSNGEIIEEYKEKKKTVLSQQSARMINEIMSDNSARAYVFGERNSLTLENRPAAAKTGTTNDFHDAWTVGYTPSLVAGVWVGNSDNKEMSGRADGSVVAAPIWNEFMKRSLEGTEIESFNKPDDYKTDIPVLDGEIKNTIIKIDIITGLPANSLTDPSLIKEVSIPNHHSILHYVNKEDPRNEPANNPESDPQYKLWEDAISDWFERTSTSTDYELLSSYSEFKDEKNNPIIRISGPKEAEEINTDFLYLNFEATAPLGISLINYYLNNNLIISEKVETKDSYEKIITLNKLANGFNSLKVQVCDPYQNCGEEKVNFNLNIENNLIDNSKNSVEILSPSSGLATSLFDFPLDFNLAVSYPNKAHSLILVVKNKEGKTVYTNYLNENIDFNNYLTIDLKESGQYSVYPELRDYNGDIIKGDSIIIIVD
ncbi:MAG: PBP1A family penicillin-binding protein [Fusobacteriaceae bacterium]|nr:PBP1A family penicillin-binding protein [Fusobacteriaceae bacterium]